MLYTIRMKQKQLHKKRKILINAGSQTGAGTIFDWGRGSKS